MIKILGKDNENLKKLIVEKNQSVAIIVTTESFISLEEEFVSQLLVE